MTSPISATHTPNTAWRRVAQALQQRICSGQLEAGQRLDTEAALAQAHGVNRHTVRRALTDLQERGLVRSVRGSGTYVQAFAIEMALGRRTSHRESLRQAGLRGEIHILSEQRLRATAEVADALGVERRSRVLCLRTLGLTHDQVLHVGERYFPLPRFGALPHEVKLSGSISLGFVACGVSQYHRASSQVAAQIPPEEIANALQQNPQRPALMVLSLNVDGSKQPIEYAKTWFAGDRVTLNIQFDEESP